MLLQASLTYKFNVTVFTHERLNYLTAIVCMLVEIGLGFENHLTLRAVVFLVVLGHLAAWFRCMGPCIHNILKLCCAYFTSVFKCVHEVVSDVVS